MITTALEAIASARHADPFSVLGPHVEHGLLTIRTCLPAAEARQRPRRRRSSAGDDPNSSRRHLRSDASRAGLAWRELRLPTSRDLSRRLQRGCGRSLPFRPGDHRLRPLPVRRGQSHPHPRQARRSPDDHRFNRGRPFRRLGPQRHPRQRRRRLQRMGRTRAPDASSRRQRRLGDLRADGGDRQSLQVRAAHRRGRDCRQGRPVRIRVRGAAAVGVDRLSPRLRLGRRGVDGPPRGCRIVVRAPDGRLRSAPGFLGADAERRK